MTTLPTLLLVDVDAVPLVADALTAAADQRTRAASGASTEVDRERRAGTDVRSRAVKVVTLLAEAQQLRALATKVAAGGPVPLEDALAARQIIAASGGPLTVAELTAGSLAAAGHTAADFVPADPATADRIAAEVEASHAAEFDAAAAAGDPEEAAPVPLADQLPPVGITDPGICLHEAWDNGRCLDCGQPVPADWTGPNLGGATTHDDD